MENFVLYRKYRPKKFAEIIGQEHIVQTLTNAIVTKMVSHAYLFSGPRGSGKTTLARLLAKAVNCAENDGYEPCNKCSSCLEINQGKAVDFIEIDAASNRGIDDIRSLREGARFAPIKLPYKVFIIDESHQLTKEASNALLKILEEPPNHTIFILATTEIHKMIPTIVSRCQSFDFKKLTVPEIIKKLEYISDKEKIKIERSALELIALNSDGALRDAEGLLDQAITFLGSEDGVAKIKAEDIRELIGAVDTNLVSQLVDFISTKETGKAIDFLNEMMEKGQDMQQLTKTLIRYLRRALLLKINSGLINSVLMGMTKEEQEKLKIQTQGFQESELCDILKLFLDAENKMKYSPILQLPLELAIIKVTNN